MPDGNKNVRVIDDIDQYFRAQLVVEIQVGSVEMYDSERCTTEKEVTAIGRSGLLRVKLGARAHMLSADARISAIIDGK